MSDQGDLQTEDEQDTWLTLSAASAMLGVSPSTVRRWADEGRIASRRTTGGHRRFDPLSLQTLSGSLREQGNEAASATTLWQVSPEQIREQHWRSTALDAQSVERMRGLGQRLLGLLIQYLVWHGDGSRFLADGRAVAANYGVFSREAGISMRDTAQAFLYFRGTFWRMAMQIPAVSHVDDAEEIRALSEKIDHFMNEVLLATIDGYEQAPALPQAEQGAE